MSDEEDTESESGDEQEDDAPEVEEPAKPAGKEEAKVVAPPAAKEGPKEEEEEEEEEDEEEEDEEEEDVLKSLNLGREQIKLLKNAFTAFDHEKKGVLGTEMIGIIIELLGHSLQPSELDNIIREVDADGSGELEFEEFCMLASKFLPEDDSEEDNPEQLKIQLKEAFRFYDRGGNGYITVEDFKGMLRELDPDIPESELQGMVNEIDQDDSGTVDFDEFMSALH